MAADESDKLANEFYKGTNVLGKPTKLSLTGTEPSAPTGLVAGGVPAAPSPGGNVTTAGGAGGMAPGAPDSTLLNALGIAQRGLGGADAVRRLGGGTEPTPGSAGVTPEVTQRGVDPGSVASENVDAGTPTRLDLEGELPTPDIGGGGGIDWGQIGGASIPALMSLFNIANTIMGSGSDTTKAIDTAGSAATGGAAAAEALGLAGSGLSASIAPFALFAQLLGMGIDDITRGESSAWINANRRDARVDSFRAGVGDPGAAVGAPGGSHQGVLARATTPEALTHYVQGLQRNPEGSVTLTLGGREIGGMGFDEIVAALEGGGSFSAHGATSGGETFNSIPAVAQAAERQYRLLGAIKRAGGPNSPAAQPFMDLMAQQTSGVDAERGPNINERSFAGYDTIAEGISIPQYGKSAEDFMREALSGAGSPEDLRAMLGGREGYSFGIQTTPSTDTAGAAWNDPLRSTPGEITDIAGGTSWADIAAALEGGGHFVGRGPGGELAGLETTAPDWSGLQGLAVDAERAARRFLPARGAAQAPTAAAPVAAAAPSESGMDLAAPQSVGTKFPWEDA